MPLDNSSFVPNIVPDNNLRLPDAVTIKHGPARLLGRFILEGDKEARRRGLRLRLRHDFEDLARLNRQHQASGDWFRLVDAFNPEYTTLTPENAFWVSGEDENGEIAATWAARVFHWPDTNLEEQAVPFFYGRDEGQPCIVTAPAAKLISGVALCSAAGWVRPDFRGKQLSQLMPRVVKAYAFARWPVDWSIGYVSRSLVEKGIAAAYGQRNFGYSIFYPGSPWGDLEVVLSYTPVADSYEDLANFMAEELLDSTGRQGMDMPVPTFSEHRVTSTSFDGVLHGNSNL
jgi:hypothetical protein